MKLNLLARWAVLALLLVCAPAFAANPKLGIGDGGTGASDAPTARTNLGLGPLATQSAIDLGSQVTGTLSTARLPFVPLNPQSNLVDVANAATARVNLGAAASGLNADITALQKGAPQLVIQGDFDPSIHLAQFNSTRTPHVCMIGDSTTTYGASNVATSDLITLRIEQMLRRQNPTKTVTVDTYGVGGSTILQINQVGYDPGGNRPSWWTVTNDTWIQAIARVAPNCNTWFVKFGTNGPGSMTIASITTLYQSLQSLGVPFDFNIITNDIASPDDPTNAQWLYQAGFRINAGMLRTFAHNWASSGIAGIGPVGLIDLGRIEQMAVYGEDPVNQYLTIDPTLTNASTSTFPVDGHASGGDFDWQFTLSNAAAWFTSGASLKVAMASLDGLDGATGGSSTAIFVTLKTTDGTTCFMNYFGGNQGNKNSSGAGLWPASGPISFRVQAKQDFIQLTCNGTVIGEYQMARPVGPFTPSLSWVGTPPTETLTTQKFSYGTPRRTIPIISLLDFWGPLDGSGLNGGGSARHASSIGLNAVYAQAIESVDMRARPPRTPPATGLTAAGSNQATALPLSASVNTISSCPTGAGAKLWPGDDGVRQIARNTDAVSCLIYPPTGAAINAGSTNAAFTLASGAAYEFIFISPTLWVASSLGSTTGAPATVASKITKFTATGTFVPDAGMVYTEFWAWGGGGGGGGGGRQASGAACSGGGGGGGGGMAYGSFTAVLIGGNKGVSVGAAGAGGLAATSDGTVGGDGGAGTSSQVTSLLIARQGTGGAGGQLAAATAGGGGGGGNIGSATAASGSTAGLGGMTPAGDGGSGANAPNNYFIGGGAGGGGAGGVNGNGGFQGGSSETAGSGGGGGGGITAANAPSGGNFGGFAFTAVSGAATHAAGGAAGVAGTAGDTGSDINGSGSGGGGGGADLVTASAGGAGGAKGGGGGGGGCTRNGGTAGAGGAGGPGMVIAVQHF